MITDVERESIFALTSIFETGRLPSPAAYGSASVLADGAGVTAGVHQATAKSGALHAVVRAYYAAGGSLGAEPRHRPPRQGWPLELVEEVLTSSVDVAPGQESQRVRALVSLLQAAGSDPRMVAAQESTFLQRYWEPALDYGQRLGLALPLSYALLYDTWIQSGDLRVDILRDTFRERPPSLGGSERPWTRALCEARRRWLSRSANPLVRRSVYRCDALLDLMDADRWDLARPLTVRGVTIR